MRAKKLPNGDVIMVTQLGATRFLRIDAQGREVRSFPVEVGTSGGRLDVTSRGNVLIPEMYSNRVAEYDATGKVIREIRIPQPIACVALPNGNVIITSMTEKRAVEIDPTDKPTWEYRRDTRVTRAVRY
jgi:streptogramin lyase